MQSFNLAEDPTEPSQCCKISIWRKVKDGSHGSHPPSSLQEGVLGQLLVFVFPPLYLRI
jgi:hypothetical protein